MPDNIELAPGGNLYGPNPNVAPFLDAPVLPDLPSVSDYTASRNNYDVTGASLDNMLRDTLANVKTNEAETKAFTGIKFSTKESGFDPIYKSFKDSLYNKIGFIPGYDNEDIYARNLGKTGQLWQGIKGVVPLIGVSHNEAWSTEADFWGNLFTGNFKKAFSLSMDQEDLQTLSDISKEINDSNFVPLTAEQREGTFNVGKLSRGLQQFGFTAGTLLQFAEQTALEMGITALGILPSGGASVAAGIGNFTRRSLKLAKTLSSVEKVATLSNVFRKVADWDSRLMNLNKIGKAYSNIKKTVGESASFSKFYKFSREYNMAASEARFERATSYTDYIEKREQEFLDRYNRPMNDAERADLEDQALDVSNANGITNIALLYAMNRVNLGNVLRTGFGLSSVVAKEVTEGIAGDIIERSAKGAGESIFKNIFKRGEKEVAEKAVETGEKAIEKSVSTRVKDPFMNKADVTAFSREWFKGQGNNAYRWFTGSAWEGVQEISQSISANYWDEYYKQKYENKGNTEENWSKLLEIGNSSLKKAVGSQMNQEGLDAFVSGFIIGMPSSAINMAVGKGQQMIYAEEYKKRQAYINEQVSHLNEWANTPHNIFNAKTENYSNQQEIKLAMQKAAAEGNIYAFKNLNRKALQQFLMIGHTTGKLDAMFDMLQTASKELTKEQFMEAYGIESDSLTKKTASDYVEKLREDSKKFIEIYDDAKRRVPNPFDSKKFKQGTKEHIEEQKREFAYNKALEEYIFQRHTSVDIVERYKSILSDAQKELGSTAYSTFYKYTNKDIIQAEIDILKSSIASYDKEAAAGFTTNKEGKESYRKQKKELEMYERWQKEMSTRERGGRLNRKTLKILTNHLNLKQKEQNLPEITAEALEKSYYDLMDLYRLDDDHVATIANLNYLADPKNFEKLYKVHEAVSSKFYKIMVSANEEKVDRRLKIAQLAQDEEFLKKHQDLFEQLQKANLEGNSTIAADIIDAIYEAEFGVKETINKSEIEKKKTDLLYSIAQLEKKLNDEIDALVKNGATVEEATKITNEKFYNTEDGNALIKLKKDLADLEKQQTTQTEEEKKPEEEEPKPTETSDKELLLKKLENINDNKQLIDFNNNVIKKIYKLTDAEIKEVSGLIMQKWEDLFGSSTIVLDENSPEFLKEYAKTINLVVGLLDKPNLSEKDVIDAFKNYNNIVKLLPAEQKQKYIDKHNEERDRILDKIRMNAKANDVVGAKSLIKNKLNTPNKTINESFDEILEIIDTLDPVHKDDLVQYFEEEYKKTIEKKIKELETISLASTSGETVSELTKIAQFEKDNLKKQLETTLEEFKTQTEKLKGSSFALNIPVDTNWTNPVHRVMTNMSGSETKDPTSGQLLVINNFIASGLISIEEDFDGVFPENIAQASEVINLGVNRINILEINKYFKYLNLQSKSPVKTVLNNKVYEINKESDMSEDFIDTLFDEMSDDLFDKVGTLGLKELKKELIELGVVVIKTKKQEFTKELNELKDLIEKYLVENDDSPYKEKMENIKNIKKEIERVFNQGPEAIRQFLKDNKIYETKPISDDLNKQLAEFRKLSFTVIAQSKLVEFIDGLENRKNELLSKNENLTIEDIVTKEFFESLKFQLKLDTKSFVPDSAYDDFINFLKNIDSIEQSKIIKEAVNFLSEVFGKDDQNKPVVNNKELRNKKSMFYNLLDFAVSTQKQANSSVAEVINITDEDIVEILNNPKRTLNASEIKKVQEFAQSVLLEEYKKKFNAVNGHKKEEIKYNPELPEGVKPSEKGFNSLRPKSNADNRSVRDLMLQLKFNAMDSTVSVQNALQFIVDSEHATESEKALAEQLLKGEFTENLVIKIDNTIKEPGEFNIDEEGNREIRINLSLIGYNEDNSEAITSAIETVILHELLHDKFETALQDEEFAKTIDSLYNSVKNVSGANTFYAFQDFLSNNKEARIREFLIEAWTNPSFQYLLLKTPYSNTKKSVWERFLEAFSKVLEKIFGVTAEGTMLGEVLSLTESLVSSVSVLEQETVSLPSEVYLEKIKNASTVEELNTLIDDLKADEINLQKDIYASLVNSINKKIQSVNAINLKEELKSYTPITIENKKYYYKIEGGKLLVKIIRNYKLQNVRKPETIETIVKELMKTKSIIEIIGRDNVLTLVDYMGDPRDMESYTNNGLEDVETIAEREFPKASTKTLRLDFSSPKQYQEFLRDFWKYKTGSLKRMSLKELESKYGATTVKSYGELANQLDKEQIDQLIKLKWISLYDKKGEFFEEATSNYERENPTADELFDMYLAILSGRKIELTPKQEVELNINNLLKSVFGVSINNNLQKEIENEINLLAEVPEVEGPNSIPEVKISSTLHLKSEADASDFDISKVDAARSKSKGDSSALRSYGDDVIPIDGKPVEKDEFVKFYYKIRNIINILSTQSVDKRKNFRITLDRDNSGLRWDGSEHNSDNVVGYLSDDNGNPLVFSPTGEMIGVLDRNNLQDTKGLNNGENQIIYFETLNANTKEDVKAKMDPKTLDVLLDTLESVKKNGPHIANLQTISHGAMNLETLTAGLTSTNKLKTQVSKNPEFREALNQDHVRILINESGTLIAEITDSIGGVHNEALFPASTKKVSINVNGVDTPLTDHLINLITFANEKAFQNINDSELGQLYTDLFNFINTVWYTNQNKEGWRITKKLDKLQVIVKDPKTGLLSVTPYPLFDKVNGVLVPNKVSFDKLTKTLNNSPINADRQLLEDSTKKFRFPSIIEQNNGKSIIFTEMDYKKFLFDDVGVSAYFMTIPKQEDLRRYNSSIKFTKPKQLIIVSPVNVVSKEDLVNNENAVEEKVEKEIKTPPNNPSSTNIAKKATGNKRKFDVMQGEKYNKIFEKNCK